tara:strand:+ start:117 stop:575 length:459 start_codon:yes stop_codon:yes gene_type:complete
MVEPEFSSLVEHFLMAQVDIALENLIPPTLFGKHEELISQKLTKNLIDAWRCEVQIINESTISDSSSNPETIIEDDQELIKTESTLMAEEDVTSTLLRATPSKSRTKKIPPKPSPYNLFCKDHPDLSKIEKAKLWTKYKADKSTKNLLNKYY